MTALIYMGAAFAEIAGCFTFWAWLRLGKSPFWIAVELLNFGPISIMIDGCRWKDKQSMAARFAFTHPDTFTAAIKLIAFVRNICAHHGRLWNKSLVIKPKKPKPNELPEFDHLNDYNRLYGVLAFMAKFMKVINPTSTWRHRLKEHIATFPEIKGVSIREAGFPDNWDKEGLWS